MAQPPLRVRAHVRNLVSSPTSPLALKFKAISDTVGYPMIFTPEWPMIWSESEAKYPDNATFIPSVVGALVSWCDAFSAWLGRDENEDVVDELLDVLRTKAKLELVLNVSSTTVQPATKFDSKKKVFEMVLPSAKAIPRSGLESRFASDFLQLFKEAPGTASATAEDLEWEDPLVLRSSDETPESLPDIATTQRPEELTKEPPYWLIVRQEQKNLVRIEGSHGPSLSLLEEYLKKWCRGEATRANRPAIVDITLTESPFGLGVLYDTLTLDTSRGRAGPGINATLVLAFVESILGYVPWQGAGSAGRVWEFKRTRAFK